MGFLGGRDGKSFEPCKALHTAWYRVRMQLEETWASQLPSYEMLAAPANVRNHLNDTVDGAYGYCGSPERGPRYERLVLPDSPVHFGPIKLPLE